MSERAKAMNRYRFFSTPVPETEEAARILNEAEFNISVRKHRMGFGMVIPPFLMGCTRRIYAAIFSFWAGVMPPMPMFGRSLLYVHSHCVA